jgi:hypothetical protein
MFDYFVAPMTCRVCGQTSPADSSTNMQTHLRDDADHRELSVGFALDPLEVRPQDITSSGYLPVAPQAADATFTLLETWECPACGSADQWARISVRDAVIAAIDSVALDRATLETSNFISDQCFMIASALSGLPGEQLMTGAVDPVAVLREHLPEGDGETR